MGLSAVPVARSDEVDEQAVTAAAASLTFGGVVWFGQTYCFRHSVALREFAIERLETVVNLMIQVGRGLEDERT